MMTQLHFMAIEKMCDGADYDKNRIQLFDGSSQATYFQKADSPLLTLGDSTITAVLKSLEIEEKIFQIRWILSTEACFDLVSVYLK
ncbi:MAG: hypothetical protein ACI9UR_000917 [Bacteroidia bacterium]|jgi:hypothetical protein